MITPLVLHMASVPYISSIHTLYRRLPTLAHNLTNILTTPLSHLVSTCRAAVERMQVHPAHEMTENEKMRCTLDSLEARSPSEEFKVCDVPKNPFVSPYYATDEVLKQLPPVKIIVSCNLVISYLRINGKSLYFVNIVDTGDGSVSG